MRQLDRPADPMCLSHYQAGKDRWQKGCPTAAEKQALWQQLSTMQGNRCAYCETAIPFVKGRTNRHIEHFQSRSDFPAHTFTWTNLFGNCNDEESCGKYKDNQARPYSVNLLIKPDVEDPADYLLFTSDGRAYAREDLVGNAALKAQETLRVFNLDKPYGSLRSRRCDAIRSYLGFISELQQMQSDISIEEARDLIEDECKKCIGSAHEGAIRQALWGVHT